MKSNRGLSVTDFDLVFHRFKRCEDKLGERQVEHMMFVEVKVENEVLGPAQRDTLSVVNGLLLEMVPVNGSPINVKARPGQIIKRDKKIVFHGIHLLRVPASESNGSGFYWDNKPIDAATLTSVLNIDVDPFTFKKLDVDRRHKPARKMEECLFA